MVRITVLGAACLVATTFAAFAQTPQFQTQVAPPPVQTPSGDGASGQSAVVQLTYSQVLGADAVRAVQDRLRQANSYRGPTDGVWGTDSQSSLTAFQQTHGLQPTGQLNEATALLLGLSPSDILRANAQPRLPAAVATATALPPVSSVPGGVSPPEVGSRLTLAATRNLQSRLRQLGYYNGTIDGQWGPSSEGAITRFQQASGIPPTGRVNPQTVAAMGLDPNNLEAPSR